VHDVQAGAADVDGAVSLDVVAALEGGGGVVLGAEGAAGVAGGGEGDVEGLEEV